jgi:hypothetical protein
MSVHLLRFFGVTLAFLLALNLVGCSGKSAESTTSVEGVVKYKGAPLPGGRITFSSAKEKGKIAAASINNDGTYKVNNPPIGEVKIGVEGPSPPSDSSKGNKPLVVLPKDYANPDKSGLTYTVKEGSQTFNVELK